MAIAQTAVAVEALNGMLRKKRKSISGSGLRGSYVSRMTSMVTDTTKKPAISGERQP